MTVLEEIIISDTDLTSHVFRRIEDRIGEAYIWMDVTGHQHCFMRNMETPFGLWVAEIYRGIAIAREVTL